MQKLKNLSSSFRPSRFRKPNDDVTQEKSVGDSSLAAENGVQHGIFDRNEQRLTTSEERTLTSETANAAPYTPTTNDNFQRGGRNGANIKRATRTRRNSVIAASLFFFISVIFLILTIIGSTHIKPVLRSTWFFQINISNIIPASAGDAILVNSLARSLGLHDFYQVGLWGFCEGYNDEGITSCSHPTVHYWFNPISIILNELLPGSTIALPAQIVNILALVKTASNIMIAFFITGCVLNTVAALVSPIVILSRWWSLPMAIFTFIAALLTTAAAIIATVMFIIFRNTFLSQPGLNINAFLGKQMFVFMWFGAAFSILGWLAHAGMGCCCASERDVTTGRRPGSKYAYPDGIAPVKEKEGGKGRRKWHAAVVDRVPVIKQKLPLFRRRKVDGESAVNS